MPTNMHSLFVSFMTKVSQTKEIHGILRRWKLKAQRMAPNPKRNWRLPSFCLFFEIV